MSADAAARRAAFERVWARPPGVGGWFTAVNNQVIGVRYMVTALVFFALGGVMALLMRVQLAVSENDFLGPAAYNELFTMHGTTMMYLFTVPFLEGLALYLVPLMIGSRDVAFPRLSAFGYWCYLFGGLVIYASFLAGTVPDAGWFAYPPLAGARYSGSGMDFWLLGLGLVEVAGLAAAAELVVSILKLRAPGMALHRLPIFVWTILAASLMILFGFTPLLVATLMLEMDRTLGTHWFNPDAGGTPLLWQHLFWFFGHPEVYIAFLPATGVVSMVVPAAARRPLTAYQLVVAAIVIIAFVSFGLWVHHMFTTGLPELALLFFAAASLAIALASGTQVFAWIATLWGTRPKFDAPLLWVLGFLFIFVLGGLTGVMVAVVPFDWQVHDTFFVVAHFHYVLIGGVVFPIVAALHYWYPKLTGRLSHAGIDRWAFWLSFVGFNATFFPMHIMGFFGLPRRVYTYPAELGIDGHNLLATAGAFVFTLGFLLVAGNLLWSLRRGPPAPDNPWGGETLEWSVSSPPPPWSFLDQPAVRSRHPQWDTPPAEPPAEVPAQAPTEWRATLCSEVLTGRPQGFQYLPGPNHLPFVAAVALTLASVGVLLKGPMMAGACGVVALATVARWIWPDPQLAARRRAAPGPLPWTLHGTAASGWWGMVALIAILAAALGTLVYGYFYLRLYAEGWPQGDLPPPPLGWSAAAYGALLVGGPAAAWARRRLAADETVLARAALWGAAALSLLAAPIIVAGLAGAGFGAQANGYATAFFSINGFFVVLALLAGALHGTAAARARDAQDPGVRLHLELAGLLGGFTTVAAALAWLVLFVSPRAW